MASKSRPSESGRAAPDGLAEWLARQRWFAAKSRRIRRIAIDDRIPVGESAILIASVELDDGGIDRYAIPLRESAGEGGIVDALDDPRFGRALIDVIAAGRKLPGIHGAARGYSTRSFPPAIPADVPVRRIASEQSNTSLVLGERLIVKQFRRLADGTNPEQEMTAFLTERTAFRSAPRLAGFLEYRRAERSATLAVAQEMIAGADDGWGWLLGELQRFYLGARAAGAPDPARLSDLARPTLDAFRRLGALTAELHAALASDRSDPAFAPEPITSADVTEWAETVDRQLLEACAVLGEAPASAIRQIVEGLGGLVGRRKIRHHGDYHLGQTLRRRSTGDFVVIDFEGEPLRPIAERRRKHAALRDVAGMLRSIDYAAMSAVPIGLPEWAEAWRRAAAAEFVAAYRACAAGAPFLPESDAAFTRAVLVFELEKAAYEVVYEARHRPEWLAIPADGLRRAAAAITSAGSTRAGAA